jgi:hypothetical protein
MRHLPCSLPLNIPLQGITRDAGEVQAGQADLPGPFDPTRDHLLVIFEGGGAYVYRLDGTPNQTRPLLTVAPRG